MEPIINRVEESDIVVFNLEEYWDDRPIHELDIEPFLFGGMVLREKEFRTHVKEHDWAAYEDAHVAVYCSADAIVPTWAYMLIATRLDGIARSVAFGRKEDLLREHFARELEKADWSEFEGRPVVVKGCGNRLIPQSAYVMATRKLQAVAAKLMFGEPCSSVPLWRKPADPAARPRAAAAKKPAIPAALRQGS